MAPSTAGGIILAGTIRVPADKMATFRPHIAAMVAASAAEPGCIAYAQSESVSDPGLIHIFEHFESEEAVAFHRATAHMAAWRAIWPQFDVGGRNMSSYDVSDYRQI